MVLSFFSLLCHIQSINHSISSEYLSILFRSVSTTISLMQFILSHLNYFKNILSHLPAFTFAPFQSFSHSATIAKYRYEHVILLANDLEESLKVLTWPTKLCIIWPILSLSSVISSCTCFSSLSSNYTDLPLIPSLSMLLATGPLNLLFSCLSIHLPFFSGQLTLII